MTSQTWRIGIQGLKSDDLYSSPYYYLWAYDLVMLLLKIFEIKMGFIRIKWVRHTLCAISTNDNIFSSLSPQILLPIQPISQSYVDLLKIPLYSHHSTTFPPSNPPPNRTACKSPITPHCQQNQASQAVLIVKNPPANTGKCKRYRCDLWVGKIRCRRAWQPTSVFSPGESRGQRSLAGYGSLGHKDLDITAT